MKSKMHFLIGDIFANQFIKTWGILLLYVLLVF